MKRQLGWRSARWAMALLALLALGGCGKKAEEEVSSQESEARVEESAPAPVVKAPEVKVAPVKRTVLGGLEATEAECAQRIVAVMFDNSEGARPQAGISQAELVYEALAEGDITRYMALFQKNAPEIGPVRSARPYFLDRAKEWNAIYAHFGGSAEADARIAAEGIADVDGIYLDGSVYRRVDYKNAPHNAYTSLEAIRNYAREQGYEAGNAISEGYPFGSEPLTGEPAVSFSVQHASNSVREYAYDAEKGVYYRFRDGEQEFDETTAQPLKVNNIIVQYCESSITDDVGHRAFEQWGEGSGWAFLDGKKAAITWRKMDEDLTRFYLENGQELVFHPGLTWIHVLDPETGEVAVTSEAARGD